jgi:hypothetical protein
MLFGATPSTHFNQLSNHLIVFILKEDYEENIILSEYIFRGSYH